MWSIFNKMYPCYPPKYFWAREVTSNNPSLQGWPCSSSTAQYCGRSMARRGVASAPQLRSDICDTRWLKKRQARCWPSQRKDSHSRRGALSTSLSYSCRWKALLWKQPFIQEWKITLGFNPCRIKTHCGHGAIQSMFLATVTDFSYI